MKSIQDLAREAWLIEFIPESDIPKLQRFHSLAIAQYREGLLAGVSEPVGWLITYDYLVGRMNRNGSPKKFDEIWSQNSFVSDFKDAEIQAANWRNRVEHQLHTADQMAAAVLRERIKTLESVVELSTVGATYPELMEYLQAEIEAIRGQR